MTTLRARMLYPVTSPPLEDGMVCVEDGVIRSWGRWDGRKAEDLGDVVVMPGLINAHCHLDYSVMRGAILPNASFTQWIRRLNDLKRTLDDDAYLASIAAGFQELLSNGTTSVFNIESFPELMVRMPPPPLRTWWFYEMIDVRNRIHPEDVVAGAFTFFEGREGWKGGFGLSPHAPYTSSQELYRLARRCCEKYQMPLMTHLAESDEEFEMFCRARGPMQDFLKTLGRDMSDTGGVSPVAHTIRGDVLPDGALLTHMNTIEESDWALLRGRRFSIIHCPCCHEYFGREPFPAARFLDEGLNLCLGTDSLASNRELNLFAEMRCLSQQHPGLAPETRIEFVTRNPARAIGMAGQLGEISEGSAADLIALPYSGSPADVAEAIAQHTGRVEWVMVGGEALSIKI
jgi:cytosine/adenosine deaminase-related metal-dependent hydrolase